MSELTKSFAESVAEKLIGQLKEGVAPWQKPWQPGEEGAGLPFNPVTGSRYKGINALQLMSEDRADQRWMTYKQAASVGAQVRKGEKGTPIQHWKFTEEQVLTDTDDKPVIGADGKPVKHTVKLERPALYSATVFNAEQIDGLPPAQPRKEQAWSPQQRAEAILAASGASIQHGERDGAFYRPSTDTIHLPGKEQFATADRYYATALHELGHWTGHPSRLDRDLAHPFGSEGYAREELRAEIASMIVGQELGVGHDPGQHAAYVGSWIKAIRDDPMEIFRAASDAEKIQNHIIGIEQRQELEQAEAQQVASFIASNQRLSGEDVIRNVDAAEPGLKNILTDEARMKTLDARVSALLQGINTSYIDETRSAIAALFQPPGDGIDSAAEESVRNAYPAVPDADLDDAQMVADFIDANIKSGRESLEANASNALPALKAILADSRRMKSLEGQVDQLLHNLNTSQIEQTRARAFGGLKHDGAQFTPDKEATMPKDHAPSSHLGDGLTLTAEETAVAEALRLKDQNSDVGDAATRAFGFSLPADWTGRTRLEQLQAPDPQQESSNSEDGWNVYAERNSNEEQQIATGVSESAARNLARRLSLVDAYSEESEFEKAAKLARIREDAVRENPVSTAEDITAAREARKDAELNATRNDADLIRRIAEQQARTSSQDSPASSGKPTYLDVPYQEREEVKSLGAKWDRKEHAWYVPAGIDPAPFQKHLRQADTPRLDEGTSDIGARPMLQREGREYLAVPYAERNAAKSAGAAWDKEARSWYAGAGADMAALARWKPDASVAQQMPGLNPRSEFADVLRSAGCVVEGEHPVMDGQKHRIGVKGEKPRENGGSGFYVGHLDGHPAGYVKNNKTGVEVRWKSKGYKLDPEQKAQLRAVAAGRLQERNVEHSRKQLQTADRVVQQMSELRPVVQLTPYMQAKGLEPLPGAFTDRQGKTTYLPGTDADGKQWTTQYIQSDGTKRFARGGRKAGCFHAVGGMDALARAPALVIAEGYATANSLASSLGHATVAAFDAGNLPAVAAALHKRFPEKPVVIAGDNDQHQEAASGHNPGRKMAQEAARLSNGRVLLPIFAPGEVARDPKGYTDFNDLANKSALGREGLDRQVRTVVAAEIQKRQVASERLTQEHTLQQRQSLKIG